MEGHKHCEMMAEYAEVARTNPKPWKEFEFQVGAKWFQCDYHPEWDVDTVYRRKPRAILVNGIEVPEPMREAPELGSYYWFPNFHFHAFTERACWVDSDANRLALSRGVVHSTKEAAAAHAKAMLGIKEWSSPAFSR